MCVHTNRLERISSVFLLHRLSTCVHTNKCIFYCWWHVLQAIHTHFNTKEFEELWLLIQDWVCMVDNDEFNAFWTQIQGDTKVSRSIAKYIAWEWLPHKEIWLATSCQNQTIFEEGDTNMLLEVYVITHSHFLFLFPNAIRYHHVLKSIWLEGKRNQHVDHLIHTLVMGFLLDLEICHKQQTLGMEGLNLAEKHCQQILTCAPETPIAKIQKINNLHFEVKLSTSNKTYQIDLDTTTCSCSDFPCIHLCKHIVAIAHFFGGANLRPQPPGNTGTSKSVTRESPD
jgi:hypothetical protein